MSRVQIETSRFGTIEVETETILHFVAPVLGFEHIKNYVLLNHADNSPFKWLQAVEDPDLAFVITNPKFFAISYEFLLPDDAVEKLGVTAAEQVMVFTIVNIPNDNPSHMTANLLAPLVVNEANLNAMQVILQDATKFNTRTRLLPDASKERGSVTVEKTSSKKGKG